MRKYYLALLLSLFSLNTFANCPDWVRKDRQGEECEKSFAQLEETFYEMKSNLCPSAEFLINTFDEYEQTIVDMKSCLRNPKMFETTKQMKNKVKMYENSTEIKVTNFENIDGSKTVFIEPNGNNENTKSQSIKNTSTQSNDCKNYTSKINDIAIAKCRFGNLSIYNNNTFDCTNLNGTTTSKYKVEDDCSITKLN